MFFIGKFNDNLSIINWLNNHNFLFRQSRPDGKNNGGFSARCSDLWVVSLNKNMSKNFLSISCQNHINKSNLNKSKRRFHGFFVVFGQTPKKIQPSEWSFHLPTTTLWNKSLATFRPLRRSDFVKFLSSNCTNLYTPQNDPDRHDPHELVGFYLRPFLIAKVAQFLLFHRVHWLMRHE